MMEISGIDYNEVIRITNVLTSSAIKTILNELDNLLLTHEVEKEAEFKYRLRKVILDEVNNLRRNFLRLLIK